MHGSVRRVCGHSPGGRRAHEQTGAEQVLPKASVFVQAKRLVRSPWKSCICTVHKTCSWGQSIRNGFHIIAKTTSLPKVPAGRGNAEALRGPEGCSRSSVAVLADVWVRSPLKLSNCTIKIYLFRIKVSIKILFTFEKSLTVQMPSRIVDYYYVPHFDGWCMLAQDVSGTFHEVAGRLWRSEQSFGHHGIYVYVQFSFAIPNPFYVKPMDVQNGLFRWRTGFAWWRNTFYTVPLDVPNDCPAHRWVWSHKRQLYHAETYS